LGHPLAVHEDEEQAPEKKRKEGGGKRKGTGKGEKIATAKFVSQSLYGQRNLRSQQTKQKERKPYYQKKLSRL